MIKRLNCWFLGNPRRITVLGRFLAILGLALLVAGIFGAHARIAFVVIMGFNSRFPIEKSLEELFPQLPVWWIPESIPGFLGVILLLSAGIYVFFAGRKISKRLETERIDA